MQPILESMASAMAEVKKSNDPTAVLKQFGQNAIMDANELLGGFFQRLKTMIDWITAKITCTHNPEVLSSGRSIRTKKN